MEELLLDSGIVHVSMSALVLRMMAALALGAVLAWRPLSRIAGAPPSRPEMIYGLLLMTVAAALVIVIIGDSLARAFGIVGLGSFVRFRSAIKDPSEVVLFFVAIGVGMACGLGMAHYAAAGVLLVSLVAVLRDRAVAQERIRPDESGAAWDDAAAGIAWPAAEEKEVRS